MENLTDAETKLAPAIAAKMEQADFDVMFISGVGEVFPFVRSHTVLNNLQRFAKAQPTVMFFPGDYSHSLKDGASLDLFVRLPVSLLFSIGLSIVRDDDLDQPIVLGHVVVPQINSIVYEEAKDTLLPQMQQLSDYVNKHQAFLQLPSKLE